MWQNPCKTNWKYQPCTDFCSVVVVAFFIHSDAFVTIFYWMFLAIFTANRFQVVLYFMLCTFFLKKKTITRKKYQAHPFITLNSPKAATCNKCKSKRHGSSFRLDFVHIFFLSCVFPLYWHGWAKHFSHIVLMSHHKVHAFCATDRTCATRQNYYENIRLPDVYVFQCLLFLQIHHYHRLTLHLFFSHITCTFVFSRLDALNAFILFQSMVSTTEPCILF